MKSFAVLGLLTITVASTMTLTGCAGMSSRDKATATGAVVGGVTGAVLTGGSATGTAVGGVVGGVIGNQVDKAKSK